MQIEIGRGRGPVRQHSVHAVDKAHPAVGVHGVHAAHHAQAGQLKIVLDDRAAEAGRRLPHALPAGAFRGEFFFRLFGCVRLQRQIAQIARRGVDVDDVGCKGGQRAVGVERQFFVEQGVTAHIKLGPDACVEQEQLQDIFDLAHRGAAENGHLFGHKALGGQQLAAQSAFFLQNESGVERIIKAAQMFPSQNKVTIW